MQWSCQDHQHAEGKKVSRRTTCCGYCEQETRQPRRSERNLAAYRKWKHFRGLQRLESFPLVLGHRTGPDRQIDMLRTMIESRSGGYWNCLRWRRTGRLVPSFTSNEDVGITGAGVLKFS